MRKYVPVPSWYLSFSGAGHLISYHLGVATTLLSASTTKNSLEEDEIRPKIDVVAGSSSGAIVAAVLGCFPHRLDEYTDRFLKDGGRAFGNFQEMLLQENTTDTALPRLKIATTNCLDGSLKLFSFDYNAQQQLPDQLEKDRILRALQASCRIPGTFHPWDLFAKEVSYPENDGIEIDGDYYVDGGIAAPAPLDKSFDYANTIIVSPISGSLSSSSSSSSICHSIRPKDLSWKLPIVGDLTARCGTFRITPSVQNLQALITSVGIASPQVLRDWYQRGVEDAEAFLVGQSIN